MNGPEDLDRLPNVEGREREVLEAALSSALRPMNPPPGFAEAVLRRAGLRGLLVDAPLVSGSAERVHRDPNAARRGSSNLRAGGLHPVLGRVLGWPAARIQAWGAGALAAAALALAVFAGEQVHLRRTQEHDLARKRALANQQFEASVRILDQTVGSIEERTREQLRRAGVSGME